jgi:hypothetical protein
VNHEKAAKGPRVGAGFRQLFCCEARLDDDQRGKTAFKGPFIVKPRFPNLLSISCLVATTLFVPLRDARADVERYKDEGAYLARLAELDLLTVQEGFEGSAWDGVRSNYPTQNFTDSIISQGITWESAGNDLWAYPTTTALISTNNNWSRSGAWGIYDNFLASTLRISSPNLIHGVGLWVDTNPDGQDVGFLFEDRGTANDPGYVLPGYGAMYPGDIHPFGHGFIGFVDPAGFNSVVVVGTLEVNEEGQLEGGTVYGADDFTIGVAAPEPSTFALAVLGLAGLIGLGRRRKR